MAVKRYTKMAYACADDMVFGKSLEPISYGFGLKIGAGEVIPEINYAPRAGTEKDPERLRKEYVDYISKDILNRAVTAGFPNVQLETEWVSQMNQAKLSVPVVAGQKEICEKYHEEYGVNCAVRQTIPDQREAEEGLRPGMGGSHAYPEKLFECAEIACENGADNLSCESVGGKEFADYAVTNGDIVGFLFGVGYLGSIDMTYIWQEFSEIAKKNKCVAGGDTLRSQRLHVHGRRFPRQRCPEDLLRRHQVHFRSQDHRCLGVRCCRSRQGLRIRGSHLQGHRRKAHRPGG